MATTEAGLLPYYSGIHTIDLFGLNTKEFAKKPADGKVLRENNFDLIVINSSITGKNCDSLLLSIQEAKSMKNIDSERSDDWSIFSKKLLRGINIQKYDAFFLEYPKNIFINKQSKAYVEISKVINNKKIYKCNFN